MRSSVPLVALLTEGAVGHGWMNIPPSRNAGVNATTASDAGCQNYACLFYSQACTIGCNCSGDPTGSFFNRTCDSAWRKEPTNNDLEYLTFNLNRHVGDPEPCAGNPISRLRDDATGKCYSHDEWANVDRWYTSSCNSKEARYCQHKTANCSDEPDCTIVPTNTCFKSEKMTEFFTGMMISWGVVDDYYGSYTCEGDHINSTVWILAPNDWTKYRPWRAPGSARVLDACGLSGGSTMDNKISGGNGSYTVAHQQGFPGSKLPPVHTKTVWTAGSTSEVSWGMSANHGGGYSYRLCPRSEPATEECFQRLPLAFVGDTQRLRWENGTEVEIPAKYLSSGTWPPGSMWARVSIPSCAGVGGGYRGVGCTDLPPQFPPPPGCDATCWGHSAPAAWPANETEWHGIDSQPIRTREIPSIVDRVRVPAHLPPGDYAVSWRWDCEQTQQIWSGCGDVSIVAA